MLQNTNPEFATFLQSTVETVQPNGFKTWDLRRFNKHKGSISLQKLPSSLLAEIASSGYYIGLRYKESTYKQSLDIIKASKTKSHLAVASRARLDEWAAKEDMNDAIIHFTSFSERVRKLSEIPHDVMLMGSVPSYKESTEVKKNTGKSVWKRTFGVHFFSTHPCLTACVVGAIVIVSV